MDHIELIERTVCGVFCISRIQLLSPRPETVAIADAKRVWATMLLEEELPVKEIAAICYVTRSTVYDRLDSFNIRIQSDATFKRQYLTCVGIVTAHEFESI